jgi:hypothetical protein
MLRKLRPSPAMIVACIALIVALGGTAWAIAANSVGTTELKNGAVTKPKLAANAVGTGKVIDNSLTGADLNKSKLGKVPSAASADNATSAANANTLDSKDSTAFALAGAEPWQFASLNNGLLHGVCYWTNYGGGYNNAAYFRDRAGVVHLKGLVKATDGVDYTCGDPNQNAAANAIIFELPAGYRPDAAWAIATISNNAPGRINVGNDGSVAIEVGFPTYANAKQWVSLDGLSFRCAPSGQNGCP